MRNHILLAVSASFLLIASAAAQVDPQDKPRYQGWMKTMQPTLALIRNAPNDAAKVAAANKLAETFDQVATYWKAKQTADAVAFAETARDTAKDIAAGKGDQTENLQKIQAQCGGCHLAHRPRAADPDRVVGGGKMPDGWSVRTDRGTVAQVKFTIEGEKFEFVLGPASTFYRADWTKSGDYTFSARMTQLKAPTHPISYGLMFGGSDLGGANQTYSYFLVRNQGDYYIANKEGEKKPQTVVDWKLHPSIVKEGADGRQVNTLGIQVKGDEVIFMVNGAEVTRLAKSKLHTDGQFAFRIGHNLDVEVDRIAK
jgi:hypothetical protein